MPSSRKKENILYLITIVTVYIIVVVNSTKFYFNIAHFFVHLYNVYTLTVEYKLKIKTFIDVMRVPMLCFTNNPLDLFD